jgi:hypothetical protein
MTIEDVTVRLDGTSGDDARLAAANQIAEIFDSHITGLFFKVLSPRIPDGIDGVDPNCCVLPRRPATLRKPCCSSA